MDDFSKYARMSAAGARPHDVYLTAKADGLDSVTLLRLLRKVFHLSLAEAKEVTVIAGGSAGSLNEHQERLLSGLEQALPSEEHAASKR